VTKNESYDALTPALLVAAVGVGVCVGLQVVQFLLGAVAVVENRLRGRQRGEEGSARS
jgi:hypothetical protein